MVERLEHLPVLALITFRPDFMPPWKTRPYITSLVLGRLARRDAETLVRHLSGAEGLPADVVGADPRPNRWGAVVPRGADQGRVRGGIASQNESGRLGIPRGRRRRWWSRRPSTTRSWPGSTDRAPVKEVAQVGACIGREFSHELLAAAAGRPEPELRVALHQLLASGLIFRRGKPPNAVYAFKHALVQEAAYRSLLRSRRRELHGAIAAILEERFPDLADTTPELLAHHSQRRARSALAADYWLKAGRRAAQASANAEAIAHFTRGLAVLGTLPDTDARAQRELELQLALGAAVRAAAWFTAAEARPVYARASSWPSGSALPAQLVHALRGLWGIAYVAGEWPRARELVDRAGIAIRRTSDPVALTVGHFMSGVTMFYRGGACRRPVGARDGARLLRPGEHRAHVLASGMDNGVHVLNHLALTLWMLGFPEASLQTAQRALDRARELAHPVSTGLALHFACHVHELRREWASAGRLADELMALGAQHDIAHFRAWGIHPEGCGPDRAGEGRGRHRATCTGALTSCAALGTRLGGLSTIPCSPAP